MGNPDVFCLRELDQEEMMEALLVAMEVLSWL